MDVHQSEHLRLFCPCFSRQDMVSFISMNKEDIGKYIVGRRSALHISQGRLAELSGVSVHTLSNLETGGGNVTLDTLLKVTKIMGLKVIVGI